MDPVMYSSVPKNSKYLEFQEFADSLSSRTFDHPPLIKGDFPGLNEYVHRNYQLLLGKPLDTLSDNMMTNLQSIFKRQFSQVTDWKVGKLYKFCSSVMFEGSFITLHGRDPSANSHNIIGAIEEKFTKFDARFSYLAANIPIELLGGTKRIRKELIDIFLPTSTAKWEGVSEIIEGRKEMFEAFEGLRDYDKAAHHFAFMWASVGNTIPATFWAVYYLLRHPEALAVVRDEIDHLLQSTGQERGPGCHIHITREQLDNLVYLESALNESFRICSASMNIRIVKEDFIFKLEGNQEVRLRKDDWVAIYPPILHMDPEVYQDPKKYKIDRYVENGKKKTTFYKRGKKLKYFLMPFGSGTSMCPGRFFAMNEVKLFIILLLVYFEAEIIEEKQLGFEKNRLGLGIALPVSDISFRFKLRP
ncbi:25-hydroxycholesterol 7-alpha-hydroxylase isoform X2 [Sphaerodactylus townsendi]|nr:25-hydroxycholesterol 7-alpha-hydroxylase isoform X2 [Sphaerodactylus townsendi]